jgi:hypothetical protein
MHSMMHDGGQVTRASGKIIRDDRQNTAPASLNLVKANLLEHPTTAG